LCDGEQRGFLSPGRSDDELDSLRTDARAWQSLGFAVEFIDAKETADAIGTASYNGALHFEGGGVLNPLAYVTGLAKILQAADVPVFTNSPAQHIRKDGRNWVIRTPEASVNAKRIVLAANGGNAALHPSLRSTTMPLLVYEYATPPISVSDRSEYFGTGVPYTDRQAYVFTVRFDTDGRVISALPEVIPKWSSQRFLREARRRFHRVYELQPSIDFTWSGTAHLNLSLMPAIYLPEGDLSVVAIQACNGRGLGVNTIIGKEVAELLTSGDSEATSVPLLQPNPIPLHAVASVMPKILMSLAHARDRWRG
jgi:glycine/D-amino acid oxidase-like deaminating enzyme